MICCCFSPKMFGFVLLRKQFWCWKKGRVCTGTGHPRGENTTSWVYGKKLRKKWRARRLGLKIYLACSWILPLAGILCKLREMRDKLREISLFCFNNRCLELDQFTLFQREFHTLWRDSRRETGGCLIHLGAYMDTSCYTVHSPATNGYCFKVVDVVMACTQMLASTMLFYCPFQIRSRIGVIRHVVKHGLLWDDLYIGFQTRLQRDPDIYHHL